MTLERRNKYKSCKRLGNGQTFGGIFFSAMAESWKKLKTTDVRSSFIVCSNRTLFRSAPMRDLLSYNSLFVGQLYEDKSLALRARDLIFFTTDLQLLIRDSSIHLAMRRF